MKYPLLRSAVALADEGFAASTVWGEGLSYEVDELVMQFIVACDDEPTMIASESETHGKGLRETVTFFGG